MFAFSTSHFSARFVAFITVLSLIMSAFPAAFFVASAEEVVPGTPAEEPVVDPAPIIEEVVEEVSVPPVEEPAPVVEEVSTEEIASSAEMVAPTVFRTARAVPNPFVGCVSQDNLIQNGGFESPSLAENAFGWDVFPTGATGLAWFISWLTGNVSAPNPALLEVQHSGIAHSAYEGMQYAELDSNWNAAPGGPYNGEDARVRIAQSIPTIPGATYRIAYAFSALPGTNASNNKLQVIVNGDIVDTHTADGTGAEDTNWSTYTREFVAVGTTSVIAFEDAGVSDTFGTLIDGVGAVRCAEPEVPAPTCAPLQNLLVNGSFEEPIVVNSSLWDKFASVSGWTIAKVSDGLGTTLELHRGWSSNVAADGAQYAELDGDHSTKIAQSVTTTPGAEYKLVWAFAPRQDTGANENKLSIKVNGAEVATNGPATQSGAVAADDWTKTAVNFVATGTSTVIEFADAGNSDSYGTFLDNAQLCLVKEAPAPSCSLTIVSDTDTLVEDSNTLAVATYDDNRAWTASIPGATWIWDAAQVANPLVDTTRTFVETFTITNPTNASLMIAADNGYQVYLNGTLVVDAIAIENNFQLGTQDTIPLMLKSGANELKVVVKNFALGGSTYASNPAGLLFKLTAEGTSQCDRTTEVAPDTYVIDGYKFNDLNADGSWDDEEPTIAGWVIELRSGEVVVATTTTNEYGYYSFEVEAGDYQVTEVQQEGWEQTATLGEADGSICYFSFGEKSLLATSADESYENPYEGQCVFGNHEAETDERTYLISGYKWNDTDGDGFWDEDEVALSGWTVRATQGEVVKTDVTDENGQYVIEVTAGNWVISEVQQSGWTQTGLRQNGETLLEGANCMLNVGLIYESFYESYGDERDFARIMKKPLYTCDFGNQQQPTVVTTDNNSPRTGTRVGSSRRPVGQVLGATTQCGLWLEEYMQQATINTPYQVMKLQVFLTLQGFYTPITMVFDATTTANVKKFQEKYASEIIKPWFDLGIVPHNRPTGFVYKTTRWKINDIMCPGIEPYPSFDGENLSSNVVIR